MKRREDWPDLLIEFIESRRDRPFVWGQNDCCIFAADWILLVTEIDYAADIRGTYNSGLGALRILDAHEGLFGLVTKLTNLNCVPVKQAQRGDIVAQETEYGLTLGICIGVMSVFVAKDGLDFSPTADSRFVWRL